MDKFDAPERIWADEDTWFAGPGKTERAQEYVRADIVATLIREAEAQLVDRACLAVSERAEWPEDEQGRTEQPELFARVINAIRAESALTALARLGQQWERDENVGTQENHVGTHEK